MEKWHRSFPSHQLLLKLSYLTARACQPIMCTEVFADRSRNISQARCPFWCLTNGFKALTVDYRYPANIQTKSDTYSTDGHRLSPDCVGNSATCLLAQQVVWSPVRWTAMVQVPSATFFISVIVTFHFQLNYTFARGSVKVSRVRP